VGTDHRLLVRTGLLREVANDIERLALGGTVAATRELVAGGTSSVTISSATPLRDETVTAALDEAGSYRLASAH